MLPCGNFLNHYGASPFKYKGITLHAIPHPK